MYKMKLQELCQGNRWGLPKYSCIKDGPDHSPHFRASVSVNGLSFDSPSASTSSKHAALNEAAMLAFLHFASPDIQPVAEGAETEETLMSSKILLNASDVKVGKQHPYKMQLQNYAQRKTLDLPFYSSKSEGPPHALQFQATVTIGGHSFDSPGHFRTLKEAEHVAAKVALMSLSLDSFEEIDAQLYKNLLQELAQSEGFTLPQYKTVKYGNPHMTFFSTVEVEGEIFHGKGNKSRKLAEQSAAKVAYTAFVERKSTRCGGDLTQGAWQEEEMLKCLPSPDPSKKLEHQAKETKDEEVEFTGKMPPSAIESPVLPKMKEIVGSAKSPASFKSLPQSSALAITGSKIEKNVDVKSYLLCNRVRVYTCIPEITLPRGVVLLPIDDCKWVAVSLEFPNEKGN